MKIRSKINPKNIGDRTQLIAQTENLPAVIKPDFTEVRSKDILKAILFAQDCATKVVQKKGVCTI